MCLQSDILGVKPNLVDVYKLQIKETGKQQTYSILSDTKTVFDTHLK